MSKGRFMMNEMGIPYEVDSRGRPKRPKPRVIRDKDYCIRTFKHYSDPDANEDETVFGEAEKGLFYNYSDRLELTKWRDATDKVLETLENRRFMTARHYEDALKHYHGYEVDLRHIVLTIHRATGNCIMVFGYACHEDKPFPAPE